MDDKSLQRHFWGMQIGTNVREKYRYRIESGQRRLWSQVECLGHLSLLRNTIYLQSPPENNTRFYCSDARTRSYCFYFCTNSQTYCNTYLQPSECRHDIIISFVSSEQREQQVSAADRHAHRRALTHQHHNCSHPRRTEALMPDVLQSRS